MSHQRRFRLKSLRRSRAVPLIAAACLLASVGATALPVGATPTAEAAGGLAFSLKWSHNFGNPGKPVALSSPMVATLDGAGASVLIGDRAGYERAYHLAGGSSVAGWPASTGGTAVDSTASVLGSGSTAKVYWGEGTSSNPSAGAYRALNAQGGKIWSVHPFAYPSGSSATVGVMSSLAIGNLRTPTDVVGGSMGQEGYEMNALTGSVHPGFPWFQADTNFSTPAVSDIRALGYDQIVEGGDSTAGNAFGYQYSNGGHIRILARTGNHGTGNPGGGLYCQYNTNQVVQSSPALGRFLGTGAMGIVVGTGTYWPGASDTNKLIAIDNSCNLKWKADLGAATVSSPALATVMGGPTSKLYVVQGTRASATSGKVFVIDGSNGKTVWSTSIPGGVYGGVTTADLGGGYQDIIAATPTGAYVLDGKSGAIIATLGAGYGFQNAALVTPDPDGTIGITLAGYDGKDQGVILHYSWNGSNGSKVNETGAWPMFHHDSKLTGDATSNISAP
jgi:hypothetical protein